MHGGPLLEKGAHDLQEMNERLAGPQKEDLSVLREWCSILCPSPHTRSLEAAFLFDAFFHGLVDMLLLLSHFSHVRLCVTHRWQPTRLPRPWDSPGKNTGVGCHFLLQCMKVKSESEVAQSCPTLRDPMDCSPPGSSAHGIFQARVLEWGAIAFSM